MFKRIGQDAQIAYKCATYDTTTVNISHRNLTHLLNFQYERINFKIHDFLCFCFKFIHYLCRQMRNNVLYIKNMVCDRCKAAVGHALTNIGLTPTNIELGVVCLKEDVTPECRLKIRDCLNALGFELLEDKQQQTIDRIKSLIIELVHYKNNKSDTNLSAYLSEKIGSDYSSLSKLFSENTGVTIEKYFILQKTERIKELLFYGEMSLSEIADMMNYSSVAYLSTQFKNITGMTPSQFKAQKVKGLTQLDKI